jgi:energy-converting hydrogenase Eha subunit H
MFSRRFVLASALLATLTAGVAHAETLRFKGTIGQQNVAMTLEVKDDLVTDATYKYDSQKSVVPISESHLFGATVVLADDDGNNFHLHLQDATGTSVTTFARTVKLTGTMQREELDIPVKLDLVPGALVR